MKTWKFTKTLVVDGRAFNEGDTIAQGDVPPGNFDSLKRLRQIVEDKEVPLDIAPAALSSAPVMAATPDKTQKPKLNK